VDACWDKALSSNPRTAREREGERERERERDVERETETQRERGREGEREEGHGIAEECEAIQLCTAVGNNAE
jgi:hypothetical protein